MNRIFVLLTIIILGGMLAACEGTPPQQVSTPPANLPGASTPAAANPTIPQPSAGQSTFTGQLVSTASGKPLAQTLVRLALFYHGGTADQGSYLLDETNSPGTTTDDSGTFVFSNLKAGEYVMVIGDIHTDYLVVSDSAGKVKVWNAEAEKVVDIGKLAVNFGQ
jgi:hypothetical protein